MKSSAFLLLLLLTFNAGPLKADEPAKPASQEEFPTVNEARGRARLLHETMHATLQVVHREYYREGEALKIPAATMRQVFRELENRQKVELRWLAVNAQAMNADHKPRNDFEKEAVEALSAGKEEFERVEGGVYRLASTIALTSDCLGCHAPNRKSNKDKAAGLIIAIPLAKP